MKYDFDIPKLVEATIPAFMRGVRQVDWLTALTHPVSFIHNAFSNFISDTNKRLKWNGQSISIKYLLQDKYPGNFEIVNQNLTARPFFIYGSGDTRNPSVFNSGSPLNPVARAVNEFDPDAVDFIINAPAIAVPDEPTKDEVVALVKQYKLHSKRFKINIA